MTTSWVMMRTELPRKPAMFPPTIGRGAAGRVVDVDGGCELFDARGRLRTVGDVAGDLFLMGAVAKGVDCVERLFA